MSIGSLSRCAAISGTAILLILFVSAGPVRPSFQDGKASTAQSSQAQQYPRQSGTFEILPYPPDLAPKAKLDPELAKCIELRAWADKVEFKQLEPVVIHYAYKHVGRQIVKISGIPSGMHSLDVDVANADDPMPRTRYGTLPRTVRGGSRLGRDGRAEITLDPRYLGRGQRQNNPKGTPATFEDIPIDEGTIVINLVRDMTNPGLYFVDVVLPVYNSDFTAKAKASSSTIRIRVLPPPEY